MFNVREATLTIRAWLDREPVATLGCEPIRFVFCGRVFTAVNPDVLSELQVGRTPFFCALGLSGVAKKQKNKKYM